MFDVPIDQVTKDQRDVAKTINFGLCYGMSSIGLSERLNIAQDKAEDFINAYFKAYPKVKDTLQNLGMKAVMRGHSITLGGRKRYFKPANSLGAQKSLERKGRNTPIQGTCADIVKRALQRLRPGLRGYDVKIINLVHDEIVLEVIEAQVEEVKGIVEKNMVEAGNDYIKTVPIIVDITADQMWRK